TDNKKYLNWRWLADALLNSVFLNLPDSFLTTLLQKDYDFPVLSEVHVQRFKETLVQHVDIELVSFLQGATEDMIASRLGVSANDSLDKLGDNRHPKLAERRLRNNLNQRHHRSPAMQLLKSEPATLASET